MYKWPNKQDAQNNTKFQSQFQTILGKKQGKYQTRPTPEEKEISVIGKRNFAGIQLALKERDIITAVDSIFSTFD